MFKVKEPRYAINRSRLATFGEYDIHLCDQCNSNTNSYSRFGGSYDLPSGITYDSPQAQSYLAGSHQFKVTEIETYQLLQYTTTI